MCGIFGYANYHYPVTVRHILNILIGGLKKVEYRGYDSAGLAVDRTDGNTSSPFVIRSVGNISALRERAFSPDIAAQLNMEAVVPNHVGIAHTRWATHGEVCERNAHPQQSNGGDFTVVHNGIMTNYMTVKQLLISEGYTFKSDTDTEVICVLAEYLYNKKGVHNFEELAVQLKHFVGGAYALLMTSSHFPGEIIACRKGSPLVVGFRQIDKNGNPRKRHAFEQPDPSLPIEVYFASDTNSFAEFTNNVVYLENDDVVYYKNGHLNFFSATELQREAVSREFQQMETTLESLSKGKYDHFMLKEIYEQSDSVVSTMRGRMDFSNDQVHLGGFSKQNVRNILCSRRILLVSCGTSLNSCIAVRPIMEELVGLPVSCENASDFVDRSPSIQRDDACIFVSQSGETADTLMALRHCREGGALCVGITNVVGSSISRETDFGAHLNAGVEVGVASTKAYTSQVVLLTLVALLLSTDSVRVQGRRREIVQGLSELSAKITEVLKNTSGAIEQLAERLKNVPSIIVLGRGYDFATAQEAALKVKELSYVHTEGINSGELKHGPLALVDERMSILAFCSDDRHMEKSKAAVQQVNARKGHVTVITSRSDAELEAAAGEVIVVPKIVDCLQCVINVIPCQLLAYYMALKRGNNVDCPRNLAKSVTVQ